MRERARMNVLSWLGWVNNTRNATKNENKYLIWKQHIINYYTLALGSIQTWSHLCLKMCQTFELCGKHPVELRHTNKQIYKSSRVMYIIATSLLSTNESFSSIHINNKLPWEQIYTKQHFTNNDDAWNVLPTMTMAEMFYPNWKCRFDFCLINWLL